MCLLAIAWHAHPRFRLVVAANRDEFHARPAAAAQIWPEAPNLLAGRDLQAGGSWLGVDRARRVAVITNFRELVRPRRNAPSRGSFVPDFLRGTEGPENFLKSIEVDATAYAGFSLLLADRNQLWLGSNRADQFARLLAPGVYGLSNHLLDTPWPKLLRVRQQLRAWLDVPTNAQQPDVHSLFAMLADRRPAAVPAELRSGLPAEAEAALSSPFVNYGGYGTRCSTVLLIAHDETLWFLEQNFDAAGERTGITEFQLNASQWTT